jgi:hypothetical protein
MPRRWTTAAGKASTSGAAGWSIGSWARGSRAEADAAPDRPLLLAGYDGMMRPAAKIPPQGKARLSEALQRLVALYEATGQKDQVARWLKELYAGAEQLPPPREGVTRRRSSDRLAPGSRALRSSPLRLLTGTRT